MKYLVFFKLNKFWNIRFHVKGFKSAAENIAAYIRQSQANVTKKKIPVKIHGRNFGDEVPHTLVGEFSR